MALIFSFEKFAGEAGTDAPARFLLVRDGDMDWEGEDLIFDKAAAETIIAAFEERGNQLPIDYHHHTLDAEKTDSEAEAPAAGWIRGLEWVDGEGLYATGVEWTDKARGQIEAREFKYYSPVLYSSKKTGKWAELHSVALTNRPRTKRMSELLQAAERMSARMETKMPKDKKTHAGQAEEIPEFPAVAEGQALLAKLIDKLGLDADATLEAVLTAAIEALGTAEPEGEGEGSEEEAASLKKLAADLGCEATAEAVSTAIAELQVKAGKHDAEAGRIEALEKAEAERVESEAVAASDMLVDAQIEAGRLLPDDTVALKAAHKMAKTDPESFKVLMGSTPVIADPKTHTVPGGVKGERGSLIKAASREFGTRPDYVKRHGVAEYVGAALEEDGQTALTDAEREALKKETN